MSLENLDMWMADKRAQEAFFMRRKTWARNLMASRGLTNPGDTMGAKFEGCEFRIIIGPRRGVRIYPVCDQAINACAQIRSGHFQLPPPHQPTEV